MHPYYNNFQPNLNNNFKTFGVTIDFISIFTWALKNGIIFKDMEGKKLTSVTDFIYYLNEKDTIYIEGINDDNYFFLKKFQKAYIKLCEEYQKDKI